MALSKPSGSTEGGSAAMTGLTISGVARRTGVGVETIRFYQREGMLDRPSRRNHGYRLYSREAVARIGFIRRAQRLGFSLHEIRDLIGLKASPLAACGDVHRRFKARARETDRRVRALQEARKSLSGLLGKCSGRRPVAECPILKTLERESR